jgi:hypothetical protein
MKGLRVIKDAVYDTSLDIINKCHIQWYHSPVVTHAVKGTKPSAGSGLFHHVAKAPDLPNNSELYPYLIMLASNALEEAGEHFEEIHVLRLGLLTRTGTPVHCGIHIDNPNIPINETWKVGLLYLKDSDGPTRFFSNENNLSDADLRELFTNQSNPFDYIGELKLEQEVHPKAGDLAIFDGNIFHESTTPVDHQTRVVLNFNFVSERRV